MELTWKTLLEVVRVDSFEDGKTRGREEGKLVGREEGESLGRLVAKRETLTRLLERRFGALPVTTRRHLDTIDDPDRLDRLTEALLDADSLATLGLER